MQKKALISVSDKSNLAELATALFESGYTILATGRTAKIINEAGIDCIEISKFTESPEIFSGRVKTLHPKVFGGILYRRDDENDKMEAKQNKISEIDIVCVNLYPFASIVNNPDVSEDVKIENIDIGGPSLIRAAAKNYKYVSVLTNPTQYREFIAKLKNNDITLETRRELAAAAFAHTALYDKLISDYFEKDLLNNNSTLRINLNLQNELRYGENPHQRSFLYGDFSEYFEHLHGKELSYNNIIDMIAAFNLVCDLDTNSCAIIKHTNPCGAATANNALEAYEKALSGDPVSAFGGIVAFNIEVDSSVAEKLNEIFTEVIIAPSFTEHALELLKKKKNRRIIRAKSLTISEKYHIKSIPGGMIVQENDLSKFPEEFRVVTNKKVSDSELSDLKFAWVICKHTKSNAIVFCKNQRVLGVGAGQMSRVDSSRIAVQKAKQHGHDLIGAVAASDAFFPFADGVEEIAESGVIAVVQPGGSVRDEEVIKAANKKDISMIFTGIRNFKH